MPVQVQMQELIRDEKLLLGSTPWVRLDRDRMAEFSRFSGMGLGQGAAADLSTEVDPFAAMSLIPFLLGGVFQITDASANRLVAVEQCSFVSSIPVDTEFAMEAMLISGKRNTAGHVIYRLGITFQLRGGDLPSIVAEVVGLAGNP